MFGNKFKKIMKLLNVYVPTTDIKSSSQRKIELNNYY